MKRRKPDAERKSILVQVMMEPPLRTSLRTLSIQAGTSEGFLIRRAVERMVAMDPVGLAKFLFEKGMK